MRAKPLPTKKFGVSRRSKSDEHNLMEHSINLARHLGIPLDTDLKRYEKKKEELKREAEMDTKMSELVSKLMLKDECANPIYLRT